jgi:AbrB family looped-hinge helix DNA binding protein
MKLKATVTSKGQITIPQPIRAKLRLEPGTVLDFDEEADHLKASKAIDPQQMHSVIGIGKAELADKSVDEWLDELRGPVELPRKRRR